MREALVSYGILVTNLQRLLRIKHAMLKNDQRKILEEWQNAGHENWSPTSFTDWLLLEIETDILIRPEQIDVAHAIISPASESNSVLQMNMGKGEQHCRFLTFQKFNFCAKIIGIDFIFQYDRLTVFRQNLLHRTHGCGNSGKQETTLANNCTKSAITPNSSDYAI
jgi:hypothetical protein